MNLIEATNYFLDEDYGGELYGVEYYEDPTIEELHQLRYDDVHNDVRVGISGGKIYAWQASQILHDGFEKGKCVKFDLRATVMQHEDLDRLLAALQDLAAREDLQSTMKDDAILRKHAYSEG